MFGVSNSLNLVRNADPLDVITGPKSKAASRRNARASLKRAAAMRRSWLAVSASSTSPLSTGSSKTDQNFDGTSAWVNELALAPANSLGSGVSGLT